MHGRNRRASNYYAVAFLALGCAYFALTPLSALAQGAGGKGVSVTVNPTTGYTVINSQTIGTPRGTTVGPSGGTPTVTVRPGGGISQTLPAGIEITGIRQNAQTLRGPLGATISTGLGSLRNAAVRCVSSLRCNGALALGSLGLDLLLDEVDGLIDPVTGHIKGTEPLSMYPPGETGTNDGWSAANIPGARFYSPEVACSNQTNAWNEINNGEAEYDSVELTSAGAGTCYGVLPNGNGVSLGPTYYFGLLNCPAGYTFTSNRCEGQPSTRDLSRDEIEDIFQDYQPQASDWNWLTGGMDFSAPDVTIDITDLPVLDGSNEPNFIENSDGTSRGTFNIYTPTAKHNGTHKPEIDVHDEQTETNYDDQGNPTGTSTSTGTMTPNPGGSASSPDIVIPTDCDFMPTVCRFIDWFTEPDTQPDPDQEIRDLVQVYEDGGRQVTVGPDSGSCPPPRTIELSLVPSVEFSFQPFCDLATAVRFWLLAISAFGAAYMTVRSI